MLGDNIRTLRIQRELSQAQLCQNICTKSMISQIESNKVLPSLSLLESLCQRLGITVADAYSFSRTSDDFEEQISLIIDLMTYKEYNTALKELKTLSTNKQIKQYKNKFTEITFLMGKCLFYLDKINESEIEFKKALHFAKSLDLLPQQIKIHNSLSVIYGRLCNHELEFEHLHQAYKICKKLNLQDRDTIKILYNLSRIHRRNGNNKMAIKTANIAIFFCDKTGVYECGGHLATIIGLIKFDQGDFRKSLEAFERAYSIYKFLDDKECIAGTYLNLAKTLLKLGLTSEGKFYIDKARLLIPSHFPNLLNELIEIEYIY